MRDLAAHVNLMFFDGTAWSDPVEVSSNSGDEDERSFDVAYEQSSGTMIIVYSDEDEGNLGFRTYEGATLSAETDIALPSAEVTIWVRLYSQPATDTIIMLLQQDGDELNANTWDGSSWGGWTEIAADGGSSYRRNFDLAFETQSGEALLVYRNGASLQPHYRTWDGTWSGESTLPALGAKPAGGIRLRANPDSDSNDIFLGVKDENYVINLDLWDGSAWGGYVEIENDTYPHHGSMTFDIAYEKDSSEALVVYSENGSDSLRYRTWDGSAWSAEVASTDVGNGKINVQLLTGIDAGEIFVAIDGSGEDLNLLEWDGSSMSATNEIDTSTVDSSNDFDRQALMACPQASAPPPTISSAANQVFNVGGAPAAISAITVTDVAGGSITAANDIRVRVPAGFNMTWLASDLLASITGTASGKVSTTVSYEDGDATLVVNVTSNFAAGEYVTVSDLSFSSFTAISASNYLELESRNDDSLTATDDKRIRIQAPTPLVVTGTYIGDGSDNRAITGLGFSPDFVIVQGEARMPVARTSTMSGDLAKPLVGGPAFDRAATTDLIRSLDADGFTTAADDRVNFVNVPYFWIAFEAQSTVKVGTYDGTGADDRSISGVGFQPTYVIVMAEGDVAAVQRFSSMSRDASSSFGAAAPAANIIQAFEADGFQIGNAAEVNADVGTYHYIAFDETAGRITVGSYVGDGWDDRDITGAGFEPDFLIVKSESTHRAIHRPRAVGSRDTSLVVAPESSQPDRLQRLSSDGFQLGSDDTVNAIGVTHHWVAFGRDPSQQPRTPWIIHWAESNPRD